MTRSGAASHPNDTYRAKVTPFARRCTELRQSIPAETAAGGFGP